MIAKRRLVSHGILALAALNGLFLLANGLFMLVAPSAWYHFVPGVTSTGPLNQHFVRDIGLIQAILGVAFIVGMLLPENRVVLWTTATSWLSAHAILHLWEVAVDICHPSSIARDFPAVSLPALIGILLSVLACATRASTNADAARHSITPG